MLLFIKGSKGRKGEKRGDLEPLDKGLLSLGFAAFVTSAEKEPQVLTCGMCNYAGNDFEDVAL